MRHSYWLAIVLIFSLSCKQEINSPSPLYTEDYIAATLHSIQPVDSGAFIAGNDTSLAEKIVAFAKKQLGVTYKYCSMSPEAGFDCSGFINYVFNHFNIQVPRSSVDFTNAGTEVPLGNCKPGDLILFTGTNSKIRTVGHIGLVIANDKGNVTFIQSTSGAEYGVTITPLNQGYMDRFVKVISILDSNH